MNEYKLSPEEYRNILTGIDIVSITMTECSAKLSNLENMNSESVIKIQKEVDHEVLGSMINIFRTYTLKASSKNLKKSFLTIKAKFKVVLSSKNEINEEFIKIYSDLSLDLNTWPYFREFAYSTSSRMDIPPLTLPLLKR